MQNDPVNTKIQLKWISTDLQLQNEVWLKQAWNQWTYINPAEIFASQQTSFTLSKLTNYSKCKRCVCSEHESMLGIKTGLLAGGRSRVATTHNILSNIHCRLLQKDTFLSREHVASAAKTTALPEQPCSAATPAKSCHSLLRQREGGRVEVACSLTYTFSHFY